MPKINLNKKHSKSPSEIRTLIEQLTQLLQQKFQIKCQLKQQEKSDTLTFKRLDMSGQLRALPNEVSITVKTGLLTGALTPVIESELKQLLNKHLS